MKAHPLVSIGVPTYNRPEGLRKCLEGLRSQSYKNIEVIISNNCSTDLAVEDISKHFEKLDHRFKYFLQQENIGGERNFNFVFQQAQGSYFMWMADDDYYEDNYIEQCIYFLEDNPAYFHVTGTPNYILNSQDKVKEEIPDINQNNSILRLFRYLLYVRKNGVFYGLFRNMVDEKSPILNCPGADWIFMGRQARRGKIKSLKEINYYRSLVGESANRKSMVKRWGLKGWSKAFFELKVARIVSSRIIEEKTLMSTGLKILIFFLLIGKFLLNSLNKRFNKNYY